MHRRPDLTSIDPSKIADPKLREIIEKSIQDKKEGRAYQRPVFNPFLYHKPDQSTSETILVAKSEQKDIVEATNQSVYLNPSNSTSSSPVYTFKISTSVIVALLLAASLPNITIQIFDPTDVARFRITDASVAQHIQNSIDISRNLQDTYSKLSVLPMSLSVDVTLCGTKKDLMTWASEPRTNSFLQVELQQVAEAIKTILNDVA